MAVSILTNRVIGSGDGAARTFSFSDLIISKSSDLVVVKRNASGVETPLSEGTDSTTYSVSVTSFPGTGSIDYPASGGTLLVTGESIAMRSVRDITQAVDLENQGGYFADTQETAFDKLTYIAQQQQDDIDRSIKFAITSTFSGIAFPDPGASGEAITWKADNTLQNSAISGAAAVSVDETDIDTVKNKMVSNALAKGWEDYKDVGHLPLAGGTLTGGLTGTTMTLTGLATLTTAVLTGTLTLDKGADLTPAAAAITLGTDGNYFDVAAGNFATINGVAGTFFTLQMDGASTLTHHATNLDIPGEADYTSAAGAIIRGFMTGAATAQILAIINADGTPVGNKGVQQIVNVVDGAVASLTTVMAYDDNIPANDKGDEVMTLAITPKNASSVLVIRVQANCNLNSGGVHCVGALFVDAVSAALVVTAKQSSGAPLEGEYLILEHIVSAASTTARTYKFRMGPESSATFTFNGENGVRRGGGLGHSTMSITEILNP